ncbi:helix-turn-helix domain-containing protein [Microlunatus sp. Y2014]|uniref:helix-turn-helix domain-containing protein n=1 Tax=Microlunatus sp. Y2014 TaxID=3418488 RepID=UPI003DA6CF90
MTVDDGDEAMVEQLEGALNRVRARPPRDMARQLVESVPLATGERIRQRRSELGLSQEALAREVTELLPGKAVWHQTVVGKVETGKRPLKVDELAALAIVLGEMSLTTLVGTDDLRQFLTVQYVETERRRIAFGRELTLRTLRQVAPDEAERYEAFVNEQIDTMPTPRADLMDYIDRNEGLIEQAVRDSEHFHNRIRALLDATDTEDQS